MIFVKGLTSKLPEDGALPFLQFTSRKNGPKILTLNRYLASALPSRFLRFLQQIFGFLYRLLLLFLIICRQFTFSCFFGYLFDNRLDCRNRRVPKKQYLAIRQIPLQQHLALASFMQKAHLALF